MRKVKIVIALAVLIAVIYFILIYTGQMTGTVVDAETGKPIDGAVVLIEWTMTKGFGLTYTISYKVKEKVTDKNGQFTVYGVLNPFANEPDLTIYKKRYVAWSSRWIFPDWRNRSNFKWGDQVFELKQFKDTYSYVDHDGFIGRSINDTIGWKDKKVFMKTYCDAEESLIIRERSERDKKRHDGLSK